MLGGVPVGVVTAVIGAPFFLAHAAPRADGVRAVIEPALQVDGVTVEARERVDPARRLAAPGARASGSRSSGPTAPASRRCCGCSPGSCVPTAGRVRPRRRRRSARWTRSAIARRLAVVPQQTALPFAMRVEEVVALGRLPHEAPLRGASPGRPGRRGRGDRAGGPRAPAGPRRPRALAGRAAARAPRARRRPGRAGAAPRRADGAPGPAPPGGGDGAPRDLNERDGTTIVAVLHDLGLAAHFFPRLVIIDHGRIIADGPPAEVLTDERIRDIFGVDPALVRLEAASTAAERAAGLPVGLDARLPVRLTRAPSASPSSSMLAALVAACGGARHRRDRRRRRPRRVPGHPSASPEAPAEPVVTGPRPAEAPSDPEYRQRHGSPDPPGSPTATGEPTGPAGAGRRRGVQRHRRQPRVLRAASQRASSGPVLCAGPATRLVRFGSGSYRLADGGRSGRLQRPGRRPIDAVRGGVLRDRRRASPPAPTSARHRSGRSTARSTRRATAARSSRPRARTPAG